MSAEIMALFGTLSSPHIDERISAATSIVSHLTRVQKDSGEGLPQDGCLESADFSYTLKRLVRGLASPTPGARLGFSVVLCEVLSRFPQLSPETVFNLILSSTPLQGSLKASEERDALFGRLFGIKCIVQSGSLFRQSQVVEDDHADNVTKLRLSVLNRLVDELSTLVRRGAFLSESVGSVLVSSLVTNILRQPESLPWKSQALNSLVHKFLVEDKTWTKEKLSMAILMQQHSVEIKWDPILSDTFPENIILSPANYEKLYSILTSDNVPVSQKHQPKPGEADGKTVSGFTELPIRPHFIHNILISASQLAPEFGLPAFYLKLFESHYFSEDSSVGHKSHGFLILIDVLKSDQVSQELKPTFLTPNCVSTLCGQLAGKDRLLHKMAQSVVSTIIGEAKRGQSSIAKGFATQIRAAKPHFDHDSRSKLMEGLVFQMSAPDLELWTQELVTAFHRGSPCWPSHQAEFSGDELDAQRHVDQFRERTLAQLCTIIRTKPASCTKTCVISILHCLLLCAFFGEKPHVTPAEPASNVRNQKKSNAPSISNESSSSASFCAALRVLCKARFYTCLLDLLNHNTVRNDAKKSKTKASVPLDQSTGYRGSEIALEILTSHLDNTLPNGRRSSLKTDGEDVKQVKAIRKIVSRLQARAIASKSISTKQDRLVLLCETVLLMSHDDQEGMAEALPLFERLENDFDALLPLNGECTSSNAPKNLVPAMANMMEILLFLHSWPIAFFRAVVERIFDAFLDCMGSESLQILVNQINPPENAEDDDDSDCSDSAANSAAERGQDLSEDSDENSSSDCEQSDTEDEPDSADESADEAFRNEVAMALGHAMAKSSESDESSAEESVVMDDDEMFALDSNLEALFQKRTGKQSTKTQNTQDLHLRLKLLELIGKFVKFQSNPSILARSIGPLMDLVRRVDSDEIVMKTKVVKILQEVSRLPRKPSFVKGDTASEPLSAQEVSGIITSVHRIARTTQVPDLPDLCLKCNLWLIDVIQSETSGLVAEDESGQPLDDLLKIHKESLEHFCVKPSTKLRPLFLTQTIKRHPSFGWLMRDDILRLITSPATRNAYRREQMLESLAKLLNSYPTRAQWTTESCKGLEEFLHKLQETIVIALPASIAMPDAENAISKGRQVGLSHVKELLKICVDAVRRTLKISTEVEKIKKDWPAQETRALAECVQQIPHSPCSELIARLVQQLVALLDITLTTKPMNGRVDKKRKKASVGDATAVVETNNSIADQAPSEAASKEKKSKKRHKSIQIENV